MSGKWFLIYRGVIYSYETFGEISNTLNQIALSLHNIPIDDDKYCALVINTRSNFITAASCETYKVTFNIDSRTYKMFLLNEYNS